ncbi:hypothetical protein ABZ897_10765 [Nonomuraea sp. NPDC046802]|uniref:hypothetical protein n=1 Tax=Nonomuraea sp. NPDC046802 TaxID=3154919 RepID=UPI0033CD8156
MVWQPFVTLCSRTARTSSTAESNFAYTRPTPSASSTPWAACAPYSRPPQHHPDQAAPNSINLLRQAIAWATSAWVSPTFFRMSTRNPSRTWATQRSPGSSNAWRSSG